MLEIKAVKTKKEIRDFINFPLNLYKGNPYYVPPLYCDEKALFKKNYHYYETSEAIYYNAYLDGKIVGRISGILQRSSNDKWNQKRVRFTRFDVIDNQEVANKLLGKVEEWALSKGMEEVVGPIGFSDLEREGLLIEGFDYLNTFEEQYNFPYYQKLIENYNYTKEVDWLEHRLRTPKEINPKLKRVSDLMMKKYNLHFSKVKSINEFIKKYGDAFFDILDITYDKIYGTVPLTNSMKKNLEKSFKLIVRPEDVSLILDENERVIAFGLLFPSISKPLQKSGGRLTPITIIKLLKAIKHPKTIDLGLIGVLPEYEMKGISSALIARIVDMLASGKYEYAETNLNLEDNLHIINQWKHFDCLQHKRRRLFIKKLNIGE